MLRTGFAGVVVAIGLVALLPAGCAVDRNGLDFVPGKDAATLDSPYLRGDHVIVGAGGDIVIGGGGSGAGGAIAAGTGGEPGGVGGATETGTGGAVVVTGTGGMSVAGTGGAVVVTGTGGTPVVPGTGGAIVTIGTGGTIVTPGTGGMVVTPGTGGTIVTPGTGGTIVTPGTGGTIVTPGTGGVVVTPGTGGMDVTPGTGGTIVTPGTGGVTVAPGTGGAPAGTGGQPTLGCNAGNCMNGCCQNGQCVTALTAQLCGHNGAQCQPCAACERCGTAGACELDPASKWDLVAVSATLNRNDPYFSTGMGPWDLTGEQFGGARPDPFVQLELPLGTVVNWTDTLVDTLTPTWNQPLNKTGMPLTASDLLPGGVSWHIQVGDDDNTSAELMCEIDSPLAAADFKAGGFSRTNLGSPANSAPSCTSISFKLTCHP